MAERKIVKMTKSYKGLNPGEIAGFEEYEADALINQGAAVAYEPPKAAEPKKADKKADKAEG
jgi:hypothetical protein